MEREEVREIGRLRVDGTIWVDGRALLPRQPGQLKALDARAGAWIVRQVALHEQVWAEAVCTEAGEANELSWVSHGVAPQGSPDVVGFFTSLTAATTILEGNDHSADNEGVVHRRWLNAGLAKLEVASDDDVVVGARVLIGVL